MIPQLGLLGSIFAVYLTAVVSPGPNTFIVTRLALAEGRRSALLAVLGVTAGNFCWLTVTLGGAHLLFERAPVLANGLCIAGALYLGWMGVRALRAAIKGGDLLTRIEGAPAPVGSAFRAGLFASLTNPNTLPFYLSLLGVTVAPEVPLWVRFGAAGGVLVLCMLWYGGLAVGFSNETVQRGYRRWAQAINYLLAGLLLWFALRLLLTMVR
jgi:threonine/homoserine/homoserine lactone efflux protein